MAFNAKNKGRSISLDYEAMKLPKINPRQGPILTSIFQLQALGVSPGASSTVSANQVPWPLTTPIVIERIGLVGEQQNVGVTVGQRVSCVLNINSVAQSGSIPPPQFPPPAALPADWSFAPSILKIPFAPQESERSFEGDQIILFPDAYSLEVYALGTFVLNDSVDFTLTIYYKLQV